MKDTEVEVGCDERGPFHEVTRGSHERRDLVTRALLVATTEVLAGILGYPKTPTKGIMIVVEVRDELLSISTVPVHGNGIDGASTTAGLKEVLEPFLPRRSIGRRRRNEGVALGFKRLNVPPPEISTMSGVDVRLSFLIRFIHAQNEPGISTLDEPREVSSLLLAPEHRHVFDPGDLAHELGLPRAPVVDISDLLGACNEGRDIDIASVGNTDLA